MVFWGIKFGPDDLNNFCPMVIEIKNKLILIQYSPHTPLHALSSYWKELRNLRGLGEVGIAYQIGDGKAVWFCLDLLLGRVGIEISNVKSMGKIKILSTYSSHVHIANKLVFVGSVSTIFYAN